MIERRKSNFDRRLGKDRRSSFKFRLFLNKKIENRRGKERRAKYELRQGWVRIGKWRIGLNFYTSSPAKFKSRFNAGSPLA